jgi:uncharacterized protein YeaO (DUF488 family)
MSPNIKIKRAYEKAVKADGLRILVDRIWPRGITKEAAAIKNWEKDLAPTTGLRKWFGHDPERWQEFQKRYIAELKQGQAIKTFIEKYKDADLITLIYSAKDEAHNQAIVLQQYLEKEFDKI